MRQGQKFACKKIEKYRKHCNAEQVEIARAASERGAGRKQAGHSTQPDADQRPHRGANLPASGQKKKLSPPRPRRAIFVA